MRQGARLCPAYLCPTSAGTKTRAASENGPTRTPANEGLASPDGDYLVLAGALHHLMGPTPDQRRGGARGLDSVAQDNPAGSLDAKGDRLRWPHPAVEPGRMGRPGRPGRRAPCGLTTHRRGDQLARGA